jgi:hypothetical protein
MPLPLPVPIPKLGAMPPNAMIDCVRCEAAVLLTCVRPYCVREPLRNLQ